MMQPCLIYLHLFGCAHARSAHKSATDPPGWPQCVLRSEWSPEAGEPFNPKTLGTLNPAPPSTKRCLPNPPRRHPSVHCWQRAHLAVRQAVAQRSELRV